MTAPRFITIQQAAKEAGVTPQTMRNRIHALESEHPGITYRIGRRIYINAKQLSKAIGHKAPLARPRQYKRSTDPLESAIHTLTKELQALKGRLCALEQQNRSK